MSSKPAPATGAIIGALPTFPHLKFKATAGAQIAVRHVFDIGPSADKIEDLAHDFIASRMGSTPCAKGQLDAVVQPLFEAAKSDRENVSLMIHWDNCGLEISTSGARLRSQIDAAANHPAGLVLNADEAATKRLLRDLRIDIKLHAQTLYRLCNTNPETIELLQARDLGALLASLGPNVMAATDSDRFIVAQAVLFCLQDAIPLMMQIRALARSPMLGAHAGKLTWKNVGSTYLEALKRPACSVRALINHALPADLDDNAALEQMIDARLLQNDPRIWEMAYKILSRLTSSRAGMPSQRFIRGVMAELTQHLGPICAVTPDVLCAEGLGRLSFMQARYNITAPHAVVAVASSLLSAHHDARTCIETLRGGSPPPDKKARSKAHPGKLKLQRTVGFLRKHFDTDRHAATAAHDRRSNPNRVLCDAAEERLAEPDAAPALEHFSVHPSYLFKYSERF